MTEKKSSSEDDRKIILTCSREEAETILEALTVQAVELQELADIYSLAAPEAQYKRAKDRARKSRELAVEIGRELKITQ